VPSAGITAPSPHQFKRASGHHRHYLFSPSLQPRPPFPSVTEATAVRRKSKLPPLSFPLFGELHLRVPCGRTTGVQSPLMIIAVCRCLRHSSLPDLIAEPSPRSCCPTPDALHQGRCVPTGRRATPSVLGAVTTPVGAPRERAWAALWAGLVLCAGFQFFCFLLKL
jgi:hypothetical protein